MHSLKEKDEEVKLLDNDSEEKFTDNYGSSLIVSDDNSEIEDGYCGSNIFYKICRPTAAFYILNHVVLIQEQL